MEIDNKKYAELGEYFPALFLLKINTNSNGNIFSNHVGESVFFHEYIHYLQNISTINGISETAFFFDSLALIIDRIRKQTDNQIQYPIPILSYPQEHQDNIELMSCYDGFSYSRSINNSIKILSVQPDKINISGRECNYLELTYGNDTINEKYVFGANAIQESMASIIEQFIYPITNNKRMVPYNLAELLVEYIYPRFGHNKANVVSLCEASLQYFESGFIFFTVLYEMAKKNFIPKSNFECIEYVEKIFPQNSSDFAVELIEAITKKLPNIIPDAFSELRDWILDSFNRCLLEKNKNKALISDIMISSYPKRYVSELFNKVGTPIIYNNSSHIWSLNKDYVSSLYILHVMGNVVDVITKKRRDCSNKIFCSASSDCKLTKQIDKNCCESPWLKYTQNDLCPFAQVWHQWGLSGKII